MHYLLVDYYQVVKSRNSMRVLREQECVKPRDPITSVLL